MVKKQLLISSICIGLLSGCGSSKPKDVAEEFALALSDVKLEKVKNISSEKVTKQVDRLVITCNKPVINSLAKESKRVSDILEKDKLKVDKIMKNLQSKMKSKIDKMHKDAIEKYGSDRNIPQKVKDKMTKDMLSIVLMPLLKKIFNELNIDSKDPKAIQEILADAMMHAKRPSHRVFKNSANRYVKKHPAPITSECVAKYTDFGLIDEINFIETKKDSPDKAMVRLEIIHKNGKSKKVSVKVEQIKKEWKVSRLPLDIGFWL
jgi:hypothetical protein